MTLVGVDALTLDEFAELLSDVLAAQGYAIDRAATVPLRIGDEVIEWSFPSIVVATKSGTRCVFVTRFGPSAAVPGYLVKYLQCSRNNDPNAALYIACLDTVGMDYKRLCKLYGLGLLTCSLRRHQIKIVLNPDSSVDIGGAFDAEVDKFLSDVEKIYAQRTQELDRNATRFKREAEKLKLADRSREFQEQRAALRTQFEELRGRIDDTRLAKSMDELEELRRLVAEEQ